MVCQVATPSTGTLVVEPTTPPAASGAADAWATFAAAVSGEWEGMTATFTKEGKPVTLPEYYVPQAYRDWGVEIHDWQSQSSMLADSEGLMATSRRMMPTVGCEADAIAFTQEACQLFQAGASGNTIAADGSYSHGPLDISAPDCFKAAFEQCLVVKPLQMRLRIVHNLQRVGAEGGWQLESVDLSSERYDSPHRGKVELLGCGGGMSPFATTQPLAAEALHGSWTASGVRYTVVPDTTSSSGGNGVSGSGAACSSAAVSGEAWTVDALLPTLLLHPKQAWSSCSISGNDVTLAAGVLLDDAGDQGGSGSSSMAVATRRIVGGRLAAAELLTLTKA